MTEIYRCWRYRTIAIGLLIAVYFVVWTPVRQVLAHHLAAPIVQLASGVPGEAGPHPAVVHFEGEHRPFVAPAGLSFLIGATVLVAAATRLRYVAVFLGAHLILGALNGLGLVAHLRGAAWGGELQDFVTIYLVDALTLVAMVLAVMLVRSPQSGDVAAIEAAAPTEG